MPLSAISRRALPPAPSLKAALAVLALGGCAAATPAADLSPRAVDAGRSWGAALERTLPALMDSGGVPGLAIATVEGGRLAWARGFGVVDGAGSAAVGAGTVFEAASLSKPVIAYAVLKLADRGV
ncbi:MAG TPA: serine hydrolase domain-containing protein, partial [Longimicrobium sp.]|nr:serine hydrolase domain-containing protein [Longimicrobium sp.]